MALTRAVPGTVIRADEYNANLDQLVPTDEPRVVTAVHEFAPESAGPPFRIGANAQGQLVAGLNADMMDGQHASAFARVLDVHLSLLL